MILRLIWIFLNPVIGLSLVVNTGNIDLHLNDNLQLDVLACMSTHTRQPAYTATVEEFQTMLTAPQLAILSNMVNVFIKHYIYL